MLPKDSDGYIKSFEPSQIKEIVNFLDNFGVVVIKNVINANQITASINSIWNNPELVSRGVKRNNPQTWDTCWPKDGKIERKGWIENTDTMLCKCSWYNRFHPNVDFVFHGIWAAKNKSDLRVKFDRYGVMRPILKPEWKTDEGWLHTDQNPKTEKDFKRYQGILTFTDSTETTGGFICIPAFHKSAWAEYCSKNPIDDDVCLLPQKEIEKYSGDAEKIYARAGSLIIWDSRLPHANFPNQSATSWRMVQYITYYPAEYDSEKRVRMRKEDASYIKKIFPLTPRQLKLIGG